MAEKSLNPRFHGADSTKLNGSVSYIFVNGPLTGKFSNWRTFDYYLHYEERVAAIAQWIHLRLPSCGPGFESQAHQLCFYRFIFKLCRVKSTKINKKRPELANIYKK